MMMITAQDFVLCEERNFPYITKTEHPFVVSIILLFASSRFTVNREQFRLENQQTRYYFQSCYYILESMLELGIGKTRDSSFNLPPGSSRVSPSKKGNNQKIARDHQTHCLTMDKAPQLELANHMPCAQRRSNERAERLHIPGPGLGANTQQ